MHLLSKYYRYLDSTSMYRVVLNMLVFMWVAALALAAAGKIPFSFHSVFGSFMLLNIVAIGTHELYRRMYSAPANIESSLITADILFFIAKPVESGIDVGWLVLLAFAAISLKYVVAYHNRHIFNPSALALVVLGLMGAPLALWWVATPWMLPFVLFAGFSLVKKIRRFAMVFIYLGVGLAITMIMGLYHHEALLSIVRGYVLSWPAIYFACFMLTEPLSIPPTQKTRFIYAALVAILGALPITFDHYGMTPELALMAGNLFAFFVLMKSRVLLTLMGRVTVAGNTEEFIFAPSEHFAHKAGQYLEWTLPHEKFDLRGIRRYFTIASGPSDEHIRLGTKFVPEGTRMSSFKAALKNLKPGDKMWVAQLHGSFTLPEDSSSPLVFIAGGIGITPFASMIRDMLARQTGEKRDVTIFYANRTESDIAYRDLLDEATKQLGVRVVHVLSEPDQEGAMGGQHFEKGFITEAMLKGYLSSLRAPMYYLSGPSMMVDNYKSMLREAGVSSGHIKTDYFPGLA